MWRIDCINLWIMLIVFYVEPSAAFYYGREYGVVKPDDPYMFVDENLILFCNLTKLELLEDSTYLYFTRDGVRIPDSYVDILTTRSVRLRYPISVPQDEGHFVCWLRQEQGNPRTIGSQHVKADYSPQRVKDVQCIVYNWVNMTCRWDLGPDYHHPEDVHVSLVWTISGDQKDCPRGHMTNTSCTWVEDGEDGFLPGHRYIMSVEVTNTRRQVINSSQPFKISTKSIVKPAPVVKLRGTARNATCLLIEWDHKDIHHEKVADVEYLSQWNVSSHWHKLKRIYFTKGLVNTSICGLTPFTEYTIRVAVKPLPRDDIDGYRSDWQYIEKVRTDPSVPEVAPEMCFGCFTDIRCEHHYQADCRNVLVYWKHIPWAKRRSVIHKYQLQYTAEDGGESRNETTLYPNTSYLLKLKNNTDYTLHLYAITSENKLSKNYSAIHLISLQNKPEIPGPVLVETDYLPDSRWTGQFELRWPDPGPSTVSFLVAWCKGSLATKKCDHEEKNEVQWQELSSITREFQITVASKDKEIDKPSNYILGVARQVRRHDGLIISSGLTWTECFYRKNSVPGVPKDVDFSKVHLAGTLKLIWDYKTCDYQGSDVYISRFVIYYCVIADASNNRCQGSEHNTTARRSARSELLEHLQEGAYYRVSMAADSQWGTSQRSEPIIAMVQATPQQGDSSNLSIIGVVLAVVLILSLIFFGICKLRSRVRKTQDKFKTTFEDNMPSLPSKIPGKSLQDRPLPQVPLSSALAQTASLAAGTSAAADKRQRGGKHKSITSETSLLGHEEPGNDDESRRRHRSGNSSTISERAKLLVDDSVTIDSGLTVSKCDSDSGAESRCSSEDHDYASVEGGSAEEGLSGNEATQKVQPAGSKTSSCQSVANTDHVCKNDAILKTQQPSCRIPEHKAAPNYAPPPPPAQLSYIQASLVPVQTLQGTALSSFKPPSQDSMTRSHSGHPAQLSVPLEQVSTASALLSQDAQSFASYRGSEAPTFPHRPQGIMINKQQYVSNIHETQFPTCVDSYSSATIATDSSQFSPSLAPPYIQHAGKGVQFSDNPQLPMTSLPKTVQLGGAVCGYPPHASVHIAETTIAPHTGGSLSSKSGEMFDGRGHVHDMESDIDNSEPIYSPPWESNFLASLSVDKRPQNYCTQPVTFSDCTSVMGAGPTT